MSGRTVLYLDINHEKELLPLSGLGLDFRHHLCGLFSVHGQLEFTGDVNRTQLLQRRCFLCSDLCQSSILPQLGHLPVLRELNLHQTSPSANNFTVSINHDYSQVLWLDVNPISQVRNIRLYLRDELGQPLPVERYHLASTLLVFPKDGDGSR